MTEKKTGVNPKHALLPCNSKILAVATHVSGLLLRKLRRPISNSNSFAAKICSGFSGNICEKHNKRSAKKQMECSTSRDASCKRSDKHASCSSKFIIRTARTRTRLECVRMVAHKRKPASTADILTASFDVHEQASVVSCRGQPGSQSMHEILRGKGEACF